MGLWNREVSRRESAESSDRVARFYDGYHLAATSIHRSLSSKRVSVRVDAAGEW